ATTYQFIEVNPIIIDQINIYEATKQAMETLATKLYHPKTLILVDAMPLNIKYPHLSIIKGDATSYCIACASILAKVYRDNIMISLSKDYPLYDFHNNKGYGTKKHLKAIAEYGYLKGIHRESFEPIKSLVNKQLSLF
ncbi:MAG: ribonuclease HII, partial [Bacilli bacterium]